MKTKPKSGQALSEYLILTALIAIASIGVIQVFSTNLRSRFATMANTIGYGERESIRAQRAQERHYKIQDLGDFNEGATNTGE